MLRKSKKVNALINYYLGNYKETLWLVGDGRSGTTWISELLTADQNYREIFEPFHKKFNNGMKTMHSTPYQRINSDNDQLENLVNKVFKGKYVHSRSESKTINRSPEGLLIKDIFANLFFMWATEKHKNIKSIFIMRHPFSVAQSKSRLKNAFWERNPEDFLNQKYLYEDFLMPFEEVISKHTDDIFIKHVKTWCIINYVPLMQMKDKNRNIVFYEELKRKPEIELLKLLSYVSIEKINERAEMILPRIKTPSRTSWGNGHSSNNYWSDNLSQSQIKQGMDILKEFNLDGIYNMDTFPNTEGLNEFWNR